MSVNKIVSYRFYQRKDRPKSGPEAYTGMLVSVNEAGEIFDVKTMEPWAPGELWELVEEYEDDQDAPLAGGGAAC